MSIELVRFTEAHKGEWDSFAEKTKNSTFLHTRKFYDHNYLNAQDDYSLMFYRKHEPVALFPAVLYEKESRRILHSHLRSTYGGVIFKNTLSVADLETVIAVLIEHAKANDIQEILIRPSFSIYHHTLSGEFDYLLWKNMFVLKARELELAIDLSLPLDDFIGDSTKRSIKKALKTGVVVEECTDYAGYWKVLEENLESRYGKKPVHSLEEILLLRQLVGEDKLRLFCAKTNNMVIGGILTFAANSRVLHAQYIASNNAYQDIRPLNAVIDFIARQAKKDGFAYFNLGMVSEPGGTELNEGLSRFKEGFGARGVVRETMHLLLNN